MLFRIPSWNIYIYFDRIWSNTIMRGLVCFAGRLCRMCALREITLALRCEQVHLLSASQYGLTLHVYFAVWRGIVKYCLLSVSSTLEIFIWGRKLSDKAKTFIPILEINANSMALLYLNEDVAAVLRTMLVSTYQYIHEALLRELH